MRPGTHYYTKIPELRHFMENLPDIFRSEGITIKNDRNEIKIIEFGDFKICVKSFNKITLANRIIYSCFRKTKAERSYKIAEALLRKGINTPLPLGYTEVVNNRRIIKNCYYASIWREHDMEMSDILKNGHPDKDNILREFAEFMATKVHPKGILHNDMSAGNVLISHSENSGYSFSLIDLNRIVIKKHISHKQGLRNLRKLTNRPFILAFLAEHYANASHENPGHFAFSLIGSQLYSSWLRRVTKRFLHSFKPHQNAAM